MFGSEIVKNSYFSNAVRFQSQYSGKQLSVFLQLLFLTSALRTFHILGANHFGAESESVTFIHGSWIGVAI